MDPYRNSLNQLFEQTFHEYDVVSASRRGVPVLAASAVLEDVVEWALVVRAWLFES